MADDSVPAAQGFLEAGPHRIWYEYHGDGRREAVCLLNGLAMHTKAWYGFLPRLLQNWDVLLYDYPGQGQSTKLDAPYNITDFARYLSAIMDQLEIRGLHLMGISYGGFVALEFARLFQERLHTLTLSGILASRERLFELYQEVSLRFYRSTREVFALYTHYMYEKIFGERFVATIPPDRFEAMRKRFFDRYVDDRHCLIRLTEAQNPFFESIEERVAGYRRVTIPTLVVAGDQDRAIPLWQQKKLLDIFPNARWELIPESGHVVYLERPDRFFGLIERFMRAKSCDF